MQIGASFGPLLPGLTISALCSNPATGLVEHITLTCMQDAITPLLGAGSIIVATLAYCIYRDTLKLRAGMV